MNVTKFSTKILTLALASTLAAAVAFCASSASMTMGKAELKSAGQLAFGPDGILFVGDSMGGSIVAVDTGDRTAARSGGKIEVKGINQKIAAMLGTAPDQILVNDVVVNPISKKAYISVSRGRAFVAGYTGILLHWAPQISPYFSYVYHVSGAIVGLTRIQGLVASSQ